MEFIGAGWMTQSLTNAITQKCFVKFASLIMLSKN